MISYFAYSTVWYVSVLHTCVHITSNKNWPGITLQPQAQPYWCSKVSPSFVDHYKHKSVLASQLMTTKIYTCEKYSTFPCLPPCPLHSSSFLPNFLWCTSSLEIFCTECYTLILSKNVSVYLTMPSMSTTKVKKWSNGYEQWLQSLCYCLPKTVKACHAPVSPKFVEHFFNVQFIS